MEKLIELLNEYEKEKKKETGLRAYEWKCYGDGHLIQATNVVHKKGIPLALIETRSLLISKTYGFIQRLVEQEKIDHAKLSNYFIDKKLFGEGLSDLKEFEILLMLLSISEQPIEDLISYLKYA